MFSMTNYYNFRKYLHNLYDQDGGIGIVTSNDLCGMILELRDTEKNINSIYINTNDYFISVDLEENVSDTDKNIIVSKLTDRIRNFITNNQEIIFRYFDNKNYEQTKRQFHDFLFSPSMFCDVSVVGNSITINL